MSASEHGMSTGQTGGQGSLLPFLRTRRERKRRAQEAVGVVWVWDHAEPMTREFAEWAELHLLPLGGVDHPRRPAVDVRPRTGLRSPRDDGPPG